MESLWFCFCFVFFLFLLFCFVFAWPMSVEIVKKLLIVAFVFYLFQSFFSFLFIFASFLFFSFLHFVVQLPFQYCFRLTTVYLPLCRLLYQSISRSKLHVVLRSSGTSYTYGKTKSDNCLKRHEKMMFIRGLGEGILIAYRYKSNDSKISKR